MAGRGQFLTGLILRYTLIWTVICLIWYMHTVVEQLLSTLGAVLVTLTPALQLLVLLYFSSRVRSYLPGSIKKTALCILLGDSHFLPPPNYTMSQIACKLQSPELAIPSPEP